MISREAAVNSAGLVKKWLPFFWLKTVAFPCEFCLPMREKEQIKRQAKSLILGKSTIFLKKTRRLEWRNLWEQVITWAILLFFHKIPVIIPLVSENFTNPAAVLVTREPAAQINSSQKKSSGVSQSFTNWWWPIWEPLCPSNSKKEELPWKTK